LAKNSATGRRFDLLAGIHHGDVVANLVGGAEVVRRQQHRDTAVLYERSQQLQDLCLDGDVESSSRLVCDDEVGVGEQGHGDHQALSLAAGELARKLAESTLGVGDLHLVEEGDCRLSVCAPPCPRVGRQQRAKPALALIS
jgi:hypothetical protein